MQTLASDSTARLDSSGYRRYCDQKFARTLEALPRGFLKEHFKQNDHRLWDIFELFKWYRYMLMLMHHLARRARERRLASQHFPEGYAKGVEVGADVNGHSRELLWTGKLRCSGKSTRRRNRGLSAGVIERLG